MEDKKKRGIFKIFNLFDLTLIVIAVAVAAALFFMRGKSSGELTGQVQTRTDICYTVELTNIVNDGAASIKPGDPVLDVVKKYSIGTVKSVELGPTMRSVNDEKGGVVRYVPVPDAQTATVVIEAQASETDTDITVDGGFIVKVGLPVSVRTPGVKADGYIVGIERGESR